MSLRNRSLLPIIAFALALLAGCSNSTNHPVPPPTGGFSNTNFSGTYTFSVFGTDMPSTSLSPFAMVGSVTACGCAAGTISGGNVDLINSAQIVPGASVNSSGSVYAITQDGRGKLTLSIAGPSGTIMVVLDFVLSSGAHGMIIRFDGNGTGSGSIDSQPSAPAQSSFAKSYAFSISGTDLSLNPLAGVGAFTLDASGNISTSGATAGVADFNAFNFTSLSSSPLPNSSLSGTVLVGTGTGPGTATLISSALGTLTFDVYVTDSTHLKLIENDGKALLVGDVFSQSSATMPSGTLVFTAAGPDPSGNPFAAGGTVMSGSTLTAGAEDINDDGVVDNQTNPAVPYAFSGTFNTSGTRTVMTLTGFVGGSVFAAYPSDGGLLFLEMDPGVGSTITGGIALTQSPGAALTASQGYGMNLSGSDIFNGGVEVDEIAQFNTTSSGMTGLLDENDFTIGNPATSNLTGTYTAGSNGNGSATFSTGVAQIFYYAADTSNILFLSVDPNVVATGALQTQTTPTAAQAAEVTARHLAMTRLSPLNRASRQKRFVRSN